MLGVSNEITTIQIYLNRIESENSECILLKNALKNIDKGTEISAKLSSRRPSFSSLNKDHVDVFEDAVKDFENISSTLKSKCNRS